MYAAAGGASLASRQARRNIRKQQQSSDVHQQFKRRFELLQAQHAPAATSDLFHHHHHHPHASFLELHHARLPALSSQDISEQRLSFGESGSSMAKEPWKILREPGVKMIVSEG
ncbi:hypothetical protein O3M35_006711 [Rhynocoris fuscipes]|uniref:Uncharacterized protein n=1 Tax=Rhynocoris fuscipes TaxID=488301 RepID=A0AAW1DI65_9HEMI